MTADRAETHRSSRPGSQIGSAGLDTVEIAYRAAWDEEHTLGARFQRWELVELNGSVRA
jgi:hypothetical protein